MEKRVLFIDLEDGHIFTFSTNRYEYRLRGELRKDANRIINPAGLYTSYNTIKALQLTELISPSLPWKSYPLEFDIRDEPGISHYYTFDNYCYEEASSTHSNGWYTLYFKRPDVKLVDTCDGRKLVTEVINKSISFTEIEQSTGLNILKVTPISLECIKDDLRRMGVKLNCDPIKPEPVKITAEDLSKNVLPDSMSNIIKESYDKMMMDALRRSYTGGFTTDPFTVFKMDKNTEEKKETKTMEKKMTETDKFLKHLKGITITSTYSKMDDDWGMPYYIYYPEMEITEDIADTLLTVLLAANRDFNHKVVFNPEKGTTSIYKRSKTITVRCKDGEFDYIIGYEMAKSKMHIGVDDYNWFNKIKNHRKTHIEYTEKKPTKKGGKK